MNPPKPLYHHRRFPPEVISHCDWLYFRFCLSYRDVEELMARCGVVVTYETIRDGSQHFGGIYAKRLRSRACPAVSRHLWGDHIVLSSWPPFTGCPELPWTHGSTFKTMGPSDQSSPRRCLNLVAVAKFVKKSDVRHSRKVNLTEP